MFQAREEASFATTFIFYSAIFCSTLRVTTIDLEEIDAYLNSVRILLMEALKEEDVWIVYYPINRAIGIGAAG